jgi:hypothetical protein
MRSAILRATWKLRRGRFVAAATIGLALTSIVAGQQPRQPVPRTSPAPRTPASKPPAKTPAAPSREATVPFRVGETLTYAVSWSQFLTAGTAVAKVIEKKPSSGSTAYSIIADGRPLPLVARFYPVYYKMETLLDSFTILAHSTSMYSEENGRPHQTNTRFDRAVRRAFYDVPAEPSLKDDFEIPANAQDGLATLYAIRSHAFKAGERFSIPVADDGSLYSVEFETRAPERVRVPLGDIDAWSLRITILDAQQQPAASNSGVWISTDARRLPVKLQSDLAIGSFVLALRAATP